MTKDNIDNYLTFKRSKVAYRIIAQKARQSGLLRSNEQIANASAKGKGKFGCENAPLQCDSRKALGADCLTAAIN